MANTKTEKKEKELAQKYEKYLDAHRERQRRYRKEKKATGHTRICKYVDAKKAEAIKQVIDIIEKEDLDKFCIAGPNSQNSEKWQVLQEFNLKKPNLD